MSFLDIPEALTIEVTEEDIEQGIPCSVGYCPIARALRRTLTPYFTDQQKEQHVLSVCPGNVLVYSGLGGLVKQYALSEESFGFIAAFDKEEPVEPVTITATFMKEFGK